MCEQDINSTNTEELFNIAVRFVRQILSEHESNQQSATLPLSPPADSCWSYML